jgi:hypothetical protein
MRSQVSFNPKDSMRNLRDWADRKIQGGEEPPWAWYQYMKLIETIDAISESIEATSKENSRQPDSRLEILTQPTDSKCRLGISQLHLGSVKKPLPM